MSRIGKSEEEVPCRSCTSFSEYMKKSKKRYFSDMTKETTEKNTNIISNNNENEGEVFRVDCPILKDELGRSTWNLLHTMAARYPKDPTKEEKKEMTTFFNIFAKFYPCDYCSKDFLNELKKHPPQTSSQDDLSMWLCRMHNTVNIKIGKPEFDCTKVHERWRDGWADGSCD